MANFGKWARLVLGGLGMAGGLVLSEILFHKDEGEEDVIEGECTVDPADDEEATDDSAEETEA